MEKNGIEEELEFLVFIACRTPKNLKQISKILGYESNYLYEKANVIEKLVSGKKLNVVEEKSIGNFERTEKIYQTNDSAFWKMLKDASEKRCPPFFKNFELIRDFYSTNGLKKIFELDELKILFTSSQFELTRKQIYQFYSKTMPVMLCLVPVLIKLVQVEKGDITAPASFFNYYVHNAVPKDLITQTRIFLSNFVINNQTAEVPDEFLKIIYTSLLEWNPNFSFGTMHEYDLANFDSDRDAFRRRLSQNKKYRKLETAIGMSYDEIKNLLE